MLTIDPIAQRDLVIGYGLVLLGALGFSAKAIIIKLAYATNVEVDAITLMALRMLFALPFFLLVAAWHNKKSRALPLDKNQWGLVIVPGLMGTGLVLSSAIIFSWFVMGSGVMTQRIGSTRFTAYTMTVASLATLVHFAFQYGATLTRSHSLTYAGWERVYSLALIMAVFFVLAGVYVVNRVNS